MPKSLYLSNVLLNHTLRNVAFTPPVQVFVALYTVAPTILGGGTEVSGGGYGRQLGTFSAAASQLTSNTVDILFPVATADWGTVVAFGLFDASSGGNMLYFNNLSASRLVLTNDPSSSL